MEPVRLRDLYLYLYGPSDSRDITFYVFQQYGAGGHFWAPILDLKVKMVLEDGKTHFLIFLMSEMTVNDILVAF